MRPFVSVTPLEESGDFLKIRQLLCIWGSDSVEDLAWLVGFGFLARGEETGQRSVGFTSFIPVNQTGGNTHAFEWGQMAGSLDPEHIHLWIKFCKNFTDFARLSTPERYSALISHILAPGGNFTVVDLLKDIGLEEDIPFWLERIDDYAGGSCDLYHGQSAGGLFVPPLNQEEERNLVVNFEEMA